MMNKSSAYCQRGFTLVEIMVVVAIIGLVLGIGVTYIFPSDEAKLEEASLRLRSAIRYAFNEAVLRGEYVRLRFHLDPDNARYAYQIENRDEPFYLSEALANEARVEAVKGEEEEVPSFSAQEAPLFEPETLPEGVKIQDIWLDYLDEPVSLGQASLYFLPNAWVSPARIHLATQDGEKTLSLSLNPATGRSKIDYVYEEPEF